MAQYEPTLAPASQTEQEGIRAHLQNCFQFDAQNQDLSDISTDLQKTYELERADIVAAKEDVIDAADQADNENDPGDTLLPEPAVKKLKMQWPFLFQSDMMRQHYNRLTGRDIYKEMKKFCDEKLDALVMYMITSSNSNIANIALKINEEENSLGLDAHERFMMALLMVANHFNDDSKSLVYNAERTLQMDELNPEQMAPCIVAFGHDPILATSFAVCAHKVALLKCGNASDAITCLFEICFVLDLEYPNLKHTVEFFERLVFDMGFGDTRIENRGKTVFTLSKKVQDLINGLDIFQEKIEKATKKN